MSKILFRYVLKKAVFHLKCKYGLEVVKVPKFAVQSQNIGRKPAANPKV